MDGLGDQCKLRCVFVCYCVIFYVLLFLPSCNNSFMGIRGDAHGNFLLSIAGLLIYHMLDRWMMP